jgi:hypothetical protein
MSSTNRGSVRSPDDLYETPEWCTEVIMKEMKMQEPILECAVGKSKKILNILKKVYTDVVGLDINEDFNPDIWTDYLTWFPDKKYKTIITNPPFSYALEFIKKSLEIVDEGDTVIMLLRLNFLESKKRFDFWKYNMPIKIIVMAERPKFFGNKSDSICYAWFVWQKGYVGDTVLTVVSGEEKC